MIKTLIKISPIFFFFVAFLIALEQFVNTGMWFDMGDIHHETFTAMFAFVGIALVCQGQVEGHDSMNNTRFIGKFAERYKDEINKFFDGTLSPIDDKVKGHVWISDHGNFQALIVEPPEGGQYEIAVRMPHPEIIGYDFFHKYSGYYTDDGGFFRGVDVNGH